MTTDTQTADPRDGVTALLIIAVLVLLAVFIGWQIAAAAFGGGVIGAALRGPGTGRNQNDQEGR